MSRHGKLAFHCSNTKCDDRNAFPTSGLISVGNLTFQSMNRRAVLAMRSIGLDRPDLQSFCGLMDLPPPVHYSTHSNVNVALEKAICRVLDQSTQTAAESEYAKQILLKMMKCATRTCHQMDRHPDTQRL